ncbi:MAG: potassium-transporting ATPase subunit KdpC [Gemmataceae bacterium]
MKSQIRSTLILVVGSLLLCCGVYPFVLWAFAQLIVPHSANGSLVTQADGKVMGSSLIAQEFKGDQYFHSRPSAASFNASASSGSNLSANNPKLRERVEEQLKTESKTETAVPADTVTTSGSGLDPHITVRNALVQAERIAAARKRPLKEIEELIERMSESPLGGLAGEPIVNVLLINRRLDVKK